MINFDTLVTSDLAALASDSRQQLLSLDESLRRIRADQERAGSQADVVLTGVSGELVVLSMVSVFAHRVGRAASGAMAVACALAILILLVNPFGSVARKFADAEFARSWPEWTAVSVIAFVGCLVMATRMIARRLAEHRFEQRLRRALGAAEPPIDIGRRLIRSADGWSVALGIAGVTSLTTLFGVVVFVVGASPWNLFWGNDPLILDVFTDRLRDLAVVIPIGLVAAVVLGRACRRERRWIRALEHGSLLSSGLVLGLVTLCVGFKLDSGFQLYAPENLPSSALRTALTVTGMLAVFLVIAGFTLRRRRREHERVGL
jgi:hypothetical protein